MRFHGLWCAAIPTLLFLGTACGGTDQQSGTGSAGQAGATASGGAASAGTGSGVSGSSQAGAGATATAGAASGGTSGASNGGASSGGSAGAATGGSAGADGGATSGGASGLYDCDPRKILCKRLAPDCPANQVPSVSGSCYGDCVPILQCGCMDAAECPDSNQYTCWSKQHCGPFVM